MEKLIIPKELTDPILKWTSKSKNRKKYFHKPPSHKGQVVGVGHLNNPTSPLYNEMMVVDKFILNKFGFELDTPIDIKDGFIISYSDSQNYQKYNFLIISYIQLVIYKTLV